MEPTKDEKLLRSMLVLWSRLDEMPISDGLVYRCGQHFVLEHGTYYPACKLRRDVQAGAPRQCYGNAIVLAAVRGWQYVEGYAIGDHGFPYPVHHAWNLDDKGSSSTARGRTRAKPTAACRSQSSEPMKRRGTETPPF